MGIVILSGDSTNRVISDVEALYNVNEQVSNDIQSIHAIIVSSDVDSTHAIIVSRDLNSDYAVAPPFRDTNFIYSLRPFITYDCSCVYTLDVLRAKTDVLSSYAVQVSNDIQNVSSIRELIKNDVLAKYLVFEDIKQTFESELDITTVDFVHKDFLGIHILFDPTPVILNYGFWVKLEGEN